MPFFNFKRIFYYIAGVISLPIYFVIFPLSILIKQLYKNDEQINDLVNINRLYKEVMSCEQTDNTAQSKDKAMELANLASKNKREIIYSDSWVLANIVLGKIALYDGDVNIASKYLLDSIKGISITPRMRSHGVDLSLANEIIETEVTEDLVKFLEKCIKIDFINPKDRKKVEDLLKKAARKSAINAAR